MTTVKLGKDEYPLEQPRLRKWLELEEIRRKLAKATETEDSSKFIEHYLVFISVALSISVEEIQDLPWIEVATAYIQIVNLQWPSFDFPMLRVKDKESDDWDYDGRYWYIWLNLLAQAYGWSIEYISELQIDDAIALMHEVISDAFYKKEWQWSLSDASVSYDKNTQQSKFNPLPKPEWMQIRTKPQEIKKVKIRKDMLPAGVIVSDPNAEQ